MVDWDKEFENLNEYENIEKLDWFNPEAGQHKIKVLEVGKEWTPKDKDGKPKYTNKSGEPQIKVRLEIEIDKKRLNWSVPKGQTTASLWGQLILLARNKGKLEDHEFTLLVKGEGKNKDYTILEALGLKKTIKEEKVIGGNI